MRTGCRRRDRIPTGPAAVSEKYHIVLAYQRTSLQYHRSCYG
jgi:hypothetical protein